MPNGANPIVAMACFTGYNQEDSIIVNQSSIERGMFRSAFFRTYQAEEHLSALNNVETKISAPKTKENLAFDENKMDYDGLARPGTRLEGEEALIWKVQKSSSVISPTSMGQQKVVDSPVFARRAETGSVDRIAIAENANGNKIAKVRVRSVRIPQIGDKFASRHGQKGTVGMTFRQ
jgi:DNA-directed RNA polymerase II subunit RPB2